MQARYPDLIDLATPRQLNAKSFLNDPISIEEPIENHANWLYRHIYSVPYPDYTGPRSLHGIQHVSRVAAYIPVLMNLYRRYGQEVPIEDMKLIQIAALFHDAGRMGEGVDLWDAESGALLYHYLTSVLKVSHEKASLLADAVTNKDKAPKNIYQKLIHDADCLDVMRVRGEFNTSELDFYKDIAKTNPKALDELAQLTTEVHSLILVHGKNKGQCEGKDAYTAIKRTMVKPLDEKKTEQKATDPINPRDHYKIFPAFHELVDHPDKTNIPLYEESKFDVLDEKKFNTLLRKGQIFFRGIGTPSAKRAKDGESKTTLEIRKMMRRLGVPTQSKKKNNQEKDGNRNRSVSMIGNGAATFTDVGFAIINPKLAHVGAVYETNAGTGTGKKNYLELKSMTDHEKKQQLNDVRTHSQIKLSLDLSSAAHNEIIYHVRPNEFKAIVYNLDDNQIHRFAAPLKAIFLQNQYKQMTDETLPIFEYSGAHHYAVKKEYSEEDIIYMWTTLCSDFLESKIKDSCSDNGSGTPINELKIKCMYGYDAFCNAPADDNYSPELREKINASIVKAREKLLLDKEREAKETLLTLNEGMVSSYLLIQYPNLLKDEKIQKKFYSSLEKTNAKSMLKSGKIAYPEVSNIFRKGFLASSNGYAQLTRLYLNVSHLQGPKIEHLKSDIIHILRNALHDLAPQYYWRILDNLNKSIPNIVTTQEIEAHYESILNKKIPNVYRLDDDIEGIFIFISKTDVNPDFFKLLVEKIDFMSNFKFFQDYFDFFNQVLARPLKDWEEKIITEVEKKWALNLFRGIDITSPRGSLEVILHKVTSIASNRKINYLLDLDVFKRIISTCSGHPHYLIILNKIKELLPNNQFNPEQINIIRLASTHIKLSDGFFKLSQQEKSDEQTVEMKITPHF